jgi:hypothetical protein
MTQAEQAALDVSPVNFPPGGNGPFASNDLSERSKRARDGWNASWYLISNSSTAARDLRNAKFLEQYRLKEPYVNLRADARGWMTNLSTGFFKSNVDRAVLKFTTSIDALPHLTASKLKDNAPESARKTNALRDIITKALRSWGGFDELKSNIAFEDVFYGRNAVVRLDRFTWQPTSFKDYDALFPDGTSQDVEKLSYFTVRQRVPVWEAKKLLLDPETSEALGWNRDNLEKAIQNSRPQDADITARLRRDQELLAEHSPASVGTGTQVKVVNFVHFFEQDWSEDNEPIVYHAIYDGNTSGGAVLLEEELPGYIKDRCALLTHNFGTGGYYGSFGMGECLANFSIAIESVRCAIIDSGKLNSCSVVMANQATMQKLGQGGMQFEWPFLLLECEPEALKLQPNAFRNDIQQLMLLDRSIAQWAERLVGLFIPSQGMQSGSDKPRTKGEVELTFSVEQEMHGALERRFQKQFMRMVGIMQYSLLDPENEDEVAKKVREEAYAQDIDDEDIEEFRNSPSFELTGENETSVERLMAALQLAQQNPNADTTTLTRLLLTRTTNESIAQATLPVEWDQIRALESTRQQLQENAMLMSGEEIPVVPTIDINAVHCATMDAKFFAPFIQTVQQINQAPAEQKFKLMPQLEGMLVGVANGISHYAAHVQGMKALKDDAWHDFAQKLTAYGNIVGEIQNEIAKSKASIASAAYQEGMANAAGEVANQQIASGQRPEVPQEPPVVEAPVGN